MLSPSIASAGRNGKQCLIRSTLETTFGFERVFRAAGLAPKLRQPVKTHFSLNGELSHGNVGGGSCWSTGSGHLPATGSGGERKPGLTSRNVRTDGHARSGQPRPPSAMICCLFSSLKTLLTATKDTRRGQFAHPRCSGVVTRMTVALAKAVSTGRGVAIQASSCLARNRVRFCGSQRSCRRD